MSRETQVVLDCNNLAREGLWHTEHCCDVCSINGSRPGACSRIVELRDGRSAYVCCKALETLIREELAIVD